MDYNIGRESDAKRNSKLTKFVSNSFQTDAQVTYAFMKSDVVIGLKYSDCQSLYVCLLTLIYIPITKEYRQEK